ncbi:hypothetical protein SISNIDRAFT_546711 [Sistotremastrum niveocremeum HHB9708]|uniref:Transmembrane protein n=1 Tax=Sistotremastrum niveocremeum HHB9708 TaxID=1314777 RepID=A0A164ZDC9_9AGAM|nr:hypothetical protein SISNIDRAFT_546711 [Sistotremastrum niveocremeum HHB9708]
MRLPPPLLICLWHFSFLSFPVNSQASPITSSTSSTSSPENSSSSRNSSLSTSHHHTNTTKHTSTIHGGLSPFKTTTSIHLPIKTHTLSSSGSIIAFIPPIPTSIPPPDRHPPGRSHGQSGWIIALEVLGALIGCGLVFLLGRCFHSYRKTPQYQHARQESIEEIRQQMRDGLRSRLLASRPPPPPYQPAPAYDTIVTPDPPPEQTSPPPRDTSSEHPVQPPGNPES